MSILGTNNTVTILSHQKFIDDLYTKVTGDKENFRFIFNEQVFAIHEPYKVSKASKTPANTINELTDVARIKQALTQLPTDYKEKLKCNLGIKSDKNVGKSVYETTETYDGCKFKGGNVSDKSVIASINQVQYLIPPNCHFYNNAVENIANHLKEKYDVIVLDPPWWNKMIRRKRKHNAQEGYNMLWNVDLAKIPIGNLLDDDGLVVVWCTNAASHTEALIETIFPKWGVELIAEWYWLKVTTTGEVIVPFTQPGGRQPFERIFFATRQKGQRRRYPLPEPYRVLVSVPSAIHSHKPPLCNVLEPFLPPNPKGLEVFARYLTPNWDSYGNEVLKLQNVALFTKKAAD